MGYMTNYGLTYTSRLGQDDNQIVSDLDAISGHWWGGVGSKLELRDVKWYSHSHGMKTLSKKHPSVLFLLSGEGEDSGDLWRKYYKNGKEQVALAKITYEPFDADKLK